jgi:hypothetical protein
MSYQARRATIIILIILTILLAAVSIYIAVGIKDDQSGEDSNAQTLVECNPSTGNTPCGGTECCAACSNGKRYCATDTLRCSDICGSLTGSQTGSTTSTTSGNTTSTTGSTTSTAQPDSVVCPNGGNQGIQKNVCLNQFCGPSYDPEFYNDNNGDNIACCKCNLKSTTTSGQTTSGQTTSGQTTSGGTKKGLGQTCVPGANECQSQYVCTLNPQTNGYTCNDPGNTDQRCGTGYSCSGFVAFKCDRLDASGRCESGQVGIYSSFNQAKSQITNSCGQVDQICVNGSNQAELDSSGTYKNCGDFQIISNGCSGSGSTGTTTTTFRCVNGGCQKVNGSGGKYPTQSACQADCRPPERQCGQTCSNNTQCGDDHSCTGGVCVLNGCTGSTCVNGCTAVCGGPCVDGDDASCPVNHSCQSGRCILSSCRGNANCTNNGCILPFTAFGDNTRDYLMLGMLFVLLGLFTYRYNMLSRFALLTTSSYKKITEKRPGVEKEKVGKKVKKGREDYERKFDKGE